MFVLVIVFIVLPFFLLGVFAAKKTVEPNASFGVGLQDFCYKEFSEKNSLLDREDGRIPGVNAALSLKSEKYLLGLSFSYTQGDVDYNGQTQGGLPYKTMTSERIVDASISLGILNLIKMTKPSVLYFGLGFHEWQRHILPTSTVFGLVETYYWPYGFFGGKVELLKRENITLWIDGRLTRPINPIMNICFSNYDCEDLHLGVKIGGRASLPIHYRWDAKNELIVEPYFESWNFGRSSDESLTINGVSAGGAIHEPRS